MNALLDSPLLAFSYADLIVVIYAALKAAQEKSNDHWDSSVFWWLSDGDPKAFFGHRDYVWNRRYEGNDAKNPKRHIFTIPVVSNIAEALWDFFHVAGTLRVILLLVGLAVAPVLGPLDALRLAVVYLLSFEAFYRVVYVRRGWMR